MNDELFIERLSAYDDALRRGNSCDTPQGNDDARLAEAIDCVNLLNRIWREPHANESQISEQTTISAGAEVGTERLTDYDPPDTTFFAENYLGDSTSAVRSIGRFEILRLLGQGGSGIVFLARDRELGRYVALKVPRPETLLTPELRRRFQLETRAAAALSHPNVVPVYEAGSLGPICYLASEYCAGPTLAEWLALGEPITFGLAAEWMTQLADAMQHAHTRGVLHRDLKPGNILLAPKESVPTSDVSDGGASAIKLSEVVPRITDFGLAKFEASDAAMTRTGALVGTAGYMAPEQVEGRTSQVDRRTDVYGLGTILYELMAGRPAFREPTNIATFMAVRHQDPVPPSLLRRNVPPDLQAICQTCLEKQPDKRYSTAADLAADLRRFLAGEPTLVRPVGPFQRGKRWVFRNRLLTALIAVVTISLLGFAVGTFWHSLRMERELDRSERLRSQALDRETKYRELSYAADMRLASEALLKTDVTQAKHLLDAHVPAADERDYRDVEWYLLTHMAVGEHAVIDDIGSPTYALAFSSNQTRLATIGKDGDLRVYDWPSGKRLLCVPTGHHEGNAVAFFKDSHTVATVGDDGALKVWDGSTNVRTIQAHQGDALDVVYSDPTNAWFTCGADGAIRGWDAATGNAIAEFRENSSSVSDLATSDDSRLLASVGRDDTLRVWDLNSKLLLKSWKNEWLSKVVAFSKDTEVFATGLMDGRFKRWAVHDWTLLPSLKTRSATSVDFSKDGRYLAIGSSTGAIWLWRHHHSHPEATVEPTLIRSWHAHDDNVTGLAFDNKHNKLISAGEDGKLKYWPGTTELTLDKLSGKLLAVSAFSDRPLVATASAREVAIIGVGDGKITRKLATDGNNWCSVAVASKVNLVAAARSNGEITIWPDWHHNPGLHRRYQLNGGLSWITLSTDGRFLVATFSERNLGPILVDLKDGTKQTGFVGASGCSAQAISPDGKLLAVGEHDSNEVLIWDVDHHRIVYRNAYHHDTVAALAFSPDSKSLAALDDSARLTLWNCSTGHLQWHSGTSPGTLQKGGSSIAFTPAGGSFVTTNALGNVGLWHTKSGREVAVLDPYLKNAVSLTFCDSGKYLCGFYQGQLSVTETGMRNSTE